jgi:phage gp36-like protein
MAYIQLTDLKGKIPTDKLIQALDDNEDGAIDNDVWAQIQSDVQVEIDGFLGQRYATPFIDPLPAVVKSAARVFAIEAVYERRNLLSEKSPERVAAQNTRKKLAAIAAGDEPLAPEQQRAKPSGVVISEKSKTQSDRTAI